MIRTDKLIVDGDKVHLIQPVVSSAIPEEEINQPGTQIVDPKQMNVVGRSDMDFHVLVN